MKEKPEEEAKADEIARWMEEGFWKSVEDATQEAIQNKSEE